MRILNILIISIPFLIYFILFLLTWRFEWEITGGLVGTVVTLILSGGCFYYGLRRQSSDKKRLLYRWSFLMLVNYIVGPVGADWNVHSYFRSGPNPYVVQTNNFAGATSGVTTKISVLEGHILLQNKRQLRSVYNYDTAEFVQKENKLFVMLGRSYVVVSKKYPPNKCFELSDEQAQEVDCNVIKT